LLLLVVVELERDQTLLLVVVAVLEDIGPVVLIQ
jgi:hypothetical protein